MVTQRQRGGEDSDRRMVAFLRGLNLGRRRLKMAELRGHFEDMRLERVDTYLASGNVVFDGEGAPAALEAAIQAHLRARLGYEVDTFIRTLPALGPVARLAGLDGPDGPGGLKEAEEKGFKPHVIFLKEAIDDAARESLVALESANDRFRPLGREVVWLRRGGLSDSPITHADLERALGGRTNTMRTLNTVRRIVAKFGAGERPSPC